MCDLFNTPEDIATTESYFTKRFKAFLIKNGNQLTFRDYMEYCLYDPEEGYYSNPARQRVGQDGDFITSVSVGETFAQLVIERIAGLLQEHEITEFNLVEYGPEGGDFAADVLKNWNSKHGTLLEYQAIEMSAKKRQLLTQRFVSLDNFSTSAEITPHSEFTVIFANEVLDAFPVHLLQLTVDGWQEVYVELTDSGLAETLHPAPAHLTTSLPNDLEIGYRTEICADYKPFFQSIHRNCEQAAILCFDYYLAGAEYYAPERAEGTLQTYYQHRKSVSPYELPGQVDLSSHVNFDTVKQAAESAGLSVSRPVTQGQYLTTHARDWLMQLNPTQPNYQKVINEFKMLTMPSMFGAKFQVVEMLKS